MKAVRTALKGWVKDLVVRAGYQLVRPDATFTFSAVFDQIERAGLSPRTVFDVGVASGTPWLYDAFPQAQLHLFDPTPGSLPYMRQLAAARGALVHPVALGATHGVMSMNVFEDESGSSFFAEIGPAPPARALDVPVRRFDEEVGAFARPALAKIDVQGAELLVLEGMGSRLAELDLILVEVSLIATVDGGAELRDVCAFLGRHDWVVADIAAILRRPLDGALAQADLLFVPVDSAMRADRRWQATVR